MKRSNRLILLIGFFLAAVAFVGVILIMGQNSSPPVAETTTNVIASVDIPLGTTITEDMVETQSVKITEKPVGAYTLESEVIGRTVTTKVTKGQLSDANWFSLTTINADIGPLLDTGRRAMAIQVDQVSGVGTLIKPGDRVDAVIGITGTDKFPVVIQDPATDQITVVPGVNATSVKAIIQNVEVVGTLLPPAADPQGDGGTAPGEGAAPSLNGQTQIVILSVSAQEAEVLEFAKVDGRITLILRSPEDKSAPNDETTGITLRELVDGWAVIPPQIVETVVPK